MRIQVPAVLKEAARKKFGGKCAYCGQTCSNLHVDHLVPVARAHQQKGMFYINDLDNLMPACPSCNNYKNAWNLEEFREELSKQVARARELSLNFRLAERFGLITVNESPITFYFERLRK